MTNPKPPIEVEKILYDFEQKSHTARIEALSELGTTKNLLNAKKEALAALNRAYGEQFLGLLPEFTSRPKLHKLFKDGKIGSAKYANELAITDILIQTSIAIHNQFLGSGK